MNIIVFNQAGFARAPVLLVLGLLAILAVAIFVVRGDYLAPSNPGPDDIRKAAAVIQVGDNLKTGVDRVFKDNKVTFTSIDTRFTSGAGSNGLFSPTGGGITPPSWSMAADPSSDGTAEKGDIWYFPKAAVPGMGTGAPEMLAVLRVDRAVCNQINNSVIGIPTPPTADLGSFYVTDINKKLFGTWPVALKGQTVGCVRNSNSDSRGNFFFEILAVQ